MRINFLLCLVMFFALLAPGYAQDIVADRTVVGEGYGVSMADALLKAKRDAVSRGIGTILISQTEVNNFVLQKDLILTRTIGAVKSYTVLSEEQQASDFFLVKIQAVVSMASIREDLAALKILLESMDKPRMMVLIQEEEGRTAENTILDYLNEKGFELVDAATVAALMQSNETLIGKATAGDPAAAAMIGARNGAEYVIVGKVTKGVMENSLLGNSGMKSGQAAISARVINCSSARVIASKSANGAAAHISEDIAKTLATEKAARKMMDHELFEKIVASFQDMLNNGIAVEITIKNVNDFKTQKAVKNVIGGLDVVSVSKRGFGNGQLKLSVVYKGNADSLSEALDGKQVAGKRLVVTDIVGSRIVAILR